MTDDDRTELRTAAETLVEVRDGVSHDETAERIDTFADQLRSMADANRGPDHGRLDRLMHNLREVADELDEESAEDVRSALEHVRSYRETVEGV
ncbi:DUF7553 family protein [Halorussus salinisoli]|uniref:DUF7553 family protein n=1 Tax=Halorussus salinisoli TaxID=2558242 RepID=UPI0010C2229B|nr:hypothetical protein [Halorussus salinisoli]